MKTLTELVNNGYFGIDVSPEISLFEYGLLCQETSDSELYCIYGIGSNDGMNYDSFDSGSITKKEIDILPTDLNSENSFLSFINSNVEDWLNDSNYVSKLYSLLSYFGYENIFGSCYESFKVSDE